MPVIAPDAPSRRAAGESMRWWNVPLLLLLLKVEAVPPSARRRLLGALSACNLVCYVGLSVSVSVREDIRAFVCIAS